MNTRYVNICLALVLFLLALETALPNERAGASDGAMQNRTRTPTATKKKPSATPTFTRKARRAYGPGGNNDGVVGGIVLPDSARATEGDNSLDVAFRSRELWFSAFVYADTSAKKTDGDGIRRVVISIAQVNPDGSEEEVNTQTENAAPFCVFGNSRPQCDGRNFVRGGKWPSSGKPVRLDLVHKARIEITTAEPDHFPFWFFDFTFQQ